NAVHEAGDDMPPGQPIIDLAPGFADWLAKKGHYGIPSNLFELDQEYSAELPQNTSTISFDINKIPELLENPTYNDFITNLINKAAELNPNNPANSNNALDLFNAIKNGTGGYFVQLVVFDGQRYGGTIYGYIANGDAKVY